MSLIKVDNAGISFDNRVNKKQKVQVLSDINLEVDEGEIVAVVGESGCGKTTLGKMIVGIHKPTEGKILYKGKDISKLKKGDFKDYRLGVQMVHQDSFAALNPNRTIFQSLSMPLLQHKIAKNKEEAENILKEYFREVGLVPEEQFLYKYPHQLSGGQRQRILLARALSVKPKLIVADEPVSMVDVSLRISLIDLMSKMNKKYNISFVYITHDLATARYIAKNGRLVVMYLGKIVEMNNIYEAIDNPKHPYFHALLAAVPQTVGRRNDGGSKSLPLRTLDMPSIINPPTGCKFHTRCPYYKDKCEKEEPKLSEYKGGYVACHLAKEVEEKRSLEKTV
ncbi:MAG: ABC transporter ATP-binding protein [Clostridium sp.]|uniref:ABC transporter ATP-binding protein n=1 Tax=Clostridium sp. DSM 8431 TaxID=1761781 RepID=UPI0008DFB5F5|nr:ABC transporter ATP-binding protein [Clostridium sp. DSM 8431]MCR4944950.1 ABC transporter ATP-binding protein [Clostridium sp.]SFU56167.1 peptide/nickel transport system ATP-binding protein [Clostridium sp. DSM 8431]